MCVCCSSESPLWSVCRKWRDGPVRDRARVSIDDVPADHHGVVFMDQVMAMHHVLAQIIPEAQEHAHFLAVAYHIHVFAALFMQWRRGAVAGQDASFFEMDMHRIDRKSTRLNSSHRCIS